MRIIWVIFFKGGRYFAAEYIIKREAVGNGLIQNNNFGKCKRIILLKVAGDLGEKSSNVAAYQI